MKRGEESGQGWGVAVMRDETLRFIMRRGSPLASSEAGYEKLPVIDRSVWGGTCGTLFHAMIRSCIFFAFVFAYFSLHPVHAAGQINPPPSSVPGIINYQGRVTVGGVNFTGTGQFKFAFVDGGVNQNQTATANAMVVAGEITQILVLGNGSGYTAAPAVTITNGAGSNGTGATAVAVLGLGAGTGTGPTDSVSSITITNAGSGYTSAIITIAPPPPNIVNVTYWSNDGTSVAGSEPASAVALGVNAGLYAVPLGDTSLANMQTIPASVFQNADVRLRVWFDDGTHGSQLLTPDQRITSAGYAMVANTAENVADGAITSAKLANGAVGSAQIASGAVTPSQLFTSSGPQSGQVLGFDGTKFAWMAASGGTVFPFDNPSTYLIEGAVLGLRNEWGDGIYGQTSAITKSGVFGMNDVAQTIFNQPAGQGVFGYGKHIAVGVLGVSEGNDGVSGVTNHAGKSGVFGYTATSGNGVSGISDGGAGVFARTNAANQSALYAYTATSNSWGVNAVSTQNNAIVGTTNNADAAAIYARNTADGLGLYVEGSAKVSTHLTVEGPGNERAYIGGSGTGEVNVGSRNLAVKVVAFRNTGIFGPDLMDILAHDATVRSLTITGGADLAEPFAMRDSAELPKGTVVVIDDKAPGQLKPSAREYDTCVAGIISGANGIHPGIAMKQDGVNETGQQVALTGRVYCLAEAGNSAIKPGDLLTTSSMPGHAMKATDHQRAQGAVLGKAMSSLDEGTGFVLVLVTLQ